jgi:ComF family protein
MHGDMWYPHDSPLMQSAGRAAMSAVEFFLPRICHVCLDRLAPDDETICDRCRKELTPTPAPVCPVCGAGPVKIDEGRCDRCPRPRHFDMANGAVRFSDAARDLVHELKFHGHTELAPLMARRCYQTMEDRWAFESPDALVPVPLHPSRFLERGFNQAEEICRELERLGRVPVATDALERIRPTRAQSSFEKRGERKANVRDAFFCDRHSDVSGKTLVLVDDVMTSASTVNECSKMLKGAGAARVLVMVFARA